MIAQTTLDQHHRLQIERLIKARSFTKRPLSWVAQTADFFYKVPRCSDRIETDMVDRRALQEARSQCEQLAFLAGLDAYVNEPVACVESHACLVFRKLLGPDLHVEIRAAPTRGAAMRALEEGLALCARLHRATDDWDGPCRLPVQDYARHTLLPAPERTRACIEAQRHSIVVHGLVIRNLRRAAPDGALYFVDPHQCLWGLPEEDVSRYVLSILMASWGRRSWRCRIWDNFDLDHLLATYESVRGRPLNRDLLSYTFDLNVAVRHNDAHSALACMPRLQRAVGSRWCQSFFRQINQWREKHGI